MPKQRNYIKLHAAAFIFAKITREAGQIADMLGNYRQNRPQIHRRSRMG